MDGQNVLLEMRFHHGALERIDAFARELVALKCSVIFPAAPYAIRAVLKATSMTTQRLLQLVPAEFSKETAKGLFPLLGLELARAGHPTQQIQMMGQPPTVKLGR